MTLLIEKSQDFLVLWLVWVDSLKIQTEKLTKITNQNRFFKCRVISWGKECNAKDWRKRISKIEMFVSIALFDELVLSKLRFKQVSQDNYSQVDF